MKKDSTKQQLFEMMHKVGGMPLNEEIDVTKNYIDRRNGKSYSGEQVLKWVNWFKTGYRITKKDRANAVNMFNALGVKPSEYKKMNTNKFKLKGDSVQYYCEGELDGYKFRVELEPSGGRTGIWCDRWYVIESDKVDPNDPEWHYPLNAIDYGDCTDMSVREFRHNLDGIIQSAVDGYKDKRPK